MLWKMTTGKERLSVEAGDEVRFQDIKSGDPPAKLKEEDIEELVARSLGLLTSTAATDGTGGTLLTIGRQVITATQKRLDLVAVDKSGALVLIEVKRDHDDVRSRKDFAEMQAVRYAASVAKLNTIEMLVQHMFAKYITDYDSKKLNEAGGLTAEEFGRRKLKEFLGDAEATLNTRQRIVLVGSGFDVDTKSAAAWLSNNGVDIQVIELRPVQFGKEYFLDAQLVIPPPKISEFYSELLGPRGTRNSSTDTGSRGTKATLPKLGDLITAKKVLAGDEISFSKRMDLKAEIVDGKRCKFDGKILSINEWASTVSGWSAVNIYDWLIHVKSNKLLRELRDELQALQASPGDIEPES